MSDRYPGRPPEKDGDPSADAPGQAQAREVALRRAEDDLSRLDAEIAEVEAYRMPLMDHLIELKDRLLRSLVALGIGCAIGFWQARPAYEFLKAPFVRALSETEGIEGGLSLVNSPFEGIFTYFKVSLVVGVMLSLPVLAWQAWAFIAPGLYKSERRIVAPLTVSSVGLFMGGAAFCYYALFPFAFPFMLSALGEDANISVGGYLSAIIQMVLAFGVSFQLPVAAFFLARMGLIDHKDMLAGFRYAVVVIFVLAAILTPPDPITQTILAVPLCGLYGVGIVVAWMFSTKVRTEDPATAAT